MMSQQLFSQACRAAARADSPAAAFLQVFRRSLATSTGSWQSSRKLVTSTTVCRPILPSSTSSHYSFSRCTPCRTQRATFSSTTPTPATKAILNPRKNEEGEDLVMKISARAAKNLRRITAPKEPPSDPSQEPPAYEYLRITVSSGGCHGFQYAMSLDDPKKVDPEEDTVFEYEPEPGEEVPEGYGGARVVMDQASLEVLYGSTVDFTQELIGSQFTIAENPRAKSSCGCGTSFDIE